MFFNLMGAETEHAVSGIEGGRRMPPGDLLIELLRRIQARYPSLPSLSGKGFFLCNGSRYYEDCTKAEATTPEVVEPYDLVRYIKAAELILSDAAAEIEAAKPGCREVYVCRGNVEYSGSKTTWGSHESYQHRCSPAVLHAALLPHLVTRIIYCGSGGWHPMSGLEFTLSPRAAHIDKVICSDSTNSGRRGGRPIVHTKDEPLTAPGNHRLHLILGDSLYSEKALMLRFGTTQLIVALLDAGAGAPPGLALRSPVAAIHTVAADVTCKAQLTLSESGKLSALEVQRRYLEWVDHHISRLPAWAPALTRLWHEILTALEHDPMSLKDTLDWPFRLALYSGYAERSGCPLEQIGNAAETVRRLHEALEHSAWQGQPLPLDFLIGPHSPVLKVAAYLTSELRNSGRSWHEVGGLAEHQRRFFELDVKLGRLGPKGLFHVLDSAGLMARHRIVRPRDIEDARMNPPGPGTRAYLRGLAVKEVSASPGRGGCDWHQVVDPAGGRVLDLTDPLASELNWIYSSHPGAFEGRPARRVRPDGESLRLFV